MEKVYDVIVVGGGPAGLTAALYLARARCSVLVLEKERFGGQIAITDEVVNYPGIERASGAELAETMCRQARSFGAELAMDEVIGLELSERVKTVRTAGGEYRALSVLLASGARPRTVGFAGEEEHRGRGVAYCATCDGEFFTGKDIFVVGGGYAAAEESVYLTRFARHVTVLIRRGGFSCAASAAEAALTHEKITVLTNTVLEEISGEGCVSRVRYKNTATGEVTEVNSPEGEYFGVFVFAGYSPASELAADLAELDGQGYIMTDDSRSTRADGLFAAGDVCAKPLRQAVTAAGDGALAASETEKYVSAARRSLGLRGEQAARKETAPTPDAGRTELFSGGVRQQLDEVFARMASPLVLKMRLDDRPASAELERFITGMAELTDKLTAETERSGGGDGETPYVSVCRADGTETGLAFHGVPGGHEFTSFVLGLYNAAGPGQQLDGETARRIAAIEGPVEMKILVTQSCTMCPDLVTAAQKIASENPAVTAHVYDVRSFEELRARYNVMSVPCLVVNGDVAAFGRKSMTELLEILEKK